MIGKTTSTQSLGVIPCAIAWLFKLINEEKDKTGARFSVRVSAMEVCGKQETLKDLLADVAQGECVVYYCSVACCFSGKIRKFMLVYLALCLSFPYFSFVTFCFFTLLVVCLSVHRISPNFTYVFDEIRIQIGLWPTTNRLDVGDDPDVMPPPPPRRHTDFLFPL